MFVQLLPFIYYILEDARAWKQSAKFHTLTLLLSKMCGSWSMLATMIMTCSVQLLLFSFFKSIISFFLFLSNLIFLLVACILHFLFTCQFYKNVTRAHPKFLIHSWNKFSKLLPNIFEDIIVQAVNAFTKTFISLLCYHLFLYLRLTVSMKSDTIPLNYTWFIRINAHVTNI